MKIAIFSAFPQELSRLKKNAAAPGLISSRSFCLSLLSYRDADLIAVETGLSIPNITNVFNSIIAEYRPDIVLSLGFGGALFYRAAVGDLLIASRFFFYTREGAVELPLLSDKSSQYQQSLWNGTMTSRLQQKIQIREGSFVSLSHWISKEKLKKSMPRDASFPICERETIHLAKLSYLQNIPFFAIRAITDLADEEIPETLFSVMDDSGRYSFARALGALVCSPSLVPGSLILSYNARVASRSLWEAAKAVVEVVGSSRMALKTRMTAQSVQSKT